MGFFFISHSLIPMPVIAWGGILLQSSTCGLAGPLHTGGQPVSIHCPLHCEGTVVPRTGFPAQETPMILFPHGDAKHNVPAFHREGKSLQCVSETLTASCCLTSGRAPAEDKV